MTNNRLLIVHPDASISSLMTSMLQTMGHKIDEAPNDRVAVRMLEHTPAGLVLAGADPNDPDALEFLTYLRRKHPQIPVILIFSTTHPERVREALQRGAAAVLRFPIPANHLRASVAQALGEPDNEVISRPAVSPASGPNPYAQVAQNSGGNGHTNGHAHGAKPANSNSSVGGEASVETSPLIGEDALMRQAVELATTIAPTRAPVLIVGEQGTGKTLLARALHARGPRRDGPFVEVDCAALREAAMELELFGRAGDGAEGNRPGKIARAEGGTIVLDQVEALSPALQLRLLRFIQEGQYEPVGATQSVSGDVRIVLSTREDLGGLVDKGQFRADFYYRISVVTLKLPPLRLRGSDVERLADHFRVRFSRQIGRSIQGFAPETLDVLRRHNWPGNVLELENVVERAVIHCRGNWIEPHHVEFRRTETRESRPVVSSNRNRPPIHILPLKEALEGPEKQLILQALEALNWNRQETARVLDINRTTLYKKMKKYNLLFDEPVWAN